MKQRPHYISSFIAPLLLLALSLLNFWGYFAVPAQILSNDPYVYGLGSLRISVWQILSSLVLVSLLHWFAVILIRLIGYYFDKLSSFNRSALELIKKLISVFIYALFALIAVDTLGIELNALLVLFGGLGVGVGIGLQRITSNFFSGFILLAERRNQIGDLIELSDIYGYIRKIALRYTLVETFDGREVLVPNEDLITNRVMNWTLNHSRGRVEIRFGVAYGSDLRQVMRIAVEAAAEHPSAAKDEQPLCFLREFGDSSINFLLIFQVADVKEGRYGPQSDVMLKIHDEFEREGIAIPYPQRDVHLIAKPE